MYKKGSLEFGFGVLTLVFMIGATIYGSITMAEQNRFVGDKSTKLVYDDKKCKVDAIVESKNQVNFKSLDEAYRSGYINAPDCI